MSERSAAILKVLRIGLSLVAFPLLAWIVWKNWDKFDVALETPWHLMLLIFSVSLLSMFANSLRLQIISRLFEIRLGVFEAFAVASANSFYNIITPMKGGIAVKGLYLNQVRGMKWTDYAGSLGITQMLATGTSSLIALIVLFAFDVVSVSLVAVLALTVVAFIALWIRFQSGLRDLLARSKYLAGLPDNFAALWASKPTLLGFAAVHILFLACISIRLFLVFSIFVPEIQFWQVVLIQSVLTAALFISFTPGNIGIQEGMVAVAGAYLAIDPATAVLASLSERAFLLLTVLPIGGLCSMQIMGKLHGSART